MPSLPNWRKNSFRGSILMIASSEILLTQPRRIPEMTHVLILSHVHSIALTTYPQVNSGKSANCCYMCPLPRQTFPPVLHTRVLYTVHIIWVKNVDNAFSRYFSVIFVQVRQPLRKKKNFPAIIVNVFAEFFTNITPSLYLKEMSHEFEMGSFIVR